MVTLLVFLLALTPSFLAVRPVAAVQAVIYVSPAGSDLIGDGSAGNPYATITNGVSHAAAGDIVMVGQGTYHEMVNVTTSITLRSQSANPYDTIIDAANLSMGIMVRGPTAAGTVVDGFSVKNANNHGIYAQDTSNVIIENNFVTNNGLHPNPAFSGEDKAINLVGTSYSIIAANVVVANKYGGIAVNDNGPLNPGFYSPGTPNPAVGNVVTGNVVAGNSPNHCAIVVSAYNAGEGVINNIVSNNIVVHNTAGIVVAANLPNTMAVNNSVIFNTILNNGEGGVILHSNSPGTIVVGNVVVGNTFSGNGFPFNIPATGPVEIPKLTGVIVGGEGPVPVRETLIKDNVFHSQYYGVYVVNGTEVSAYSNTFDQSVTVPIFGASVSQEPLAAEVGTLSSTLTGLQNTLSALQSSSAKASDLTALSNTVSTLSGTVSGLQSSSAKQSDLNSLQSNLNSLSSDVDAVSANFNTITYISYAGLVVALIAVGLAVALFRRPAPK